MKVVAIVQARMGSVRLPGKVMTPVLGRPVIDLLLARLARAKRVDAIGVATSLNAENDPLVEHLKAQSVAVFRGDEHDVLARFHGAAKAFGADVVIRITGDCPLLDPQLVDAVVDCFVSSGADYASNVAPPTYPDGLDVEVFSFAALDRAMREATASAEREHVTPYLRESGKFRTASIRNEHDLSDRRWTLDTAADLEVIRAVFEHFGDEIHFTWKQALDLQAQKPELFAANHSILRNEGQTMSSGQKLWQKAKQVVAGGNMLLSKRPDMFLPEKWPSYFSKAKGCHVWDLDGREYVDVTLMGVGTNTLGYGDEAVDRAVQDVISKGNMSTLNCPEEVWLAEKLIELHPFAEMVRFARSGGEANAVAIRIARAAAGREKVAVCGYHGWHDWYLAANLADDQLSGHLLPGLEPRGVPRELKGSIHPFNYNRFDELQAIVDQHDIGVIKMEVIRSGEPQDGFLQKVRDLATKRGIVLIFDECTSGFRQSYGGIHKLYGVEPDVAVFGKALGNGYAVTAIAGRRSVMEAAQSTFISSTFWTERIGVTAGLKTLERMAEVKSWEVITEAGHYARKGWERLASKHNLAIDISGIPALSSFAFKSGNMLAYKTLITQEMLKKGYLATNVIYTCLQHTPQLLDQYLDALDPVFGLIAECEAGRKVEDLLEGPVCTSGFKRLN